MVQYTIWNKKTRLPETTVTCETGWGVTVLRTRRTVSRYKGTHLRCAIGCPLWWHAHWPMHTWRNTRPSSGEFSVSWVVTFVHLCYFCIPLYHIDRECPKSEVGQTWRLLTIVRPGEGRPHHRIKHNTHKLNCLPNNFASATQLPVKNFFLNYIIISFIFKFCSVLIVSAWLDLFRW